MCTARTTSPCDLHWKNGFRALRRALCRFLFSMEVSSQLSWLRSACSEAKTSARNSSAPASTELCSPGMVTRTAPAHEPFLDGTFRGETSQTQGAYLALSFKAVSSRCHKLRLAASWLSGTCASAARSPCHRSRILLLIRCVFEVLSETRLESWMFEPTKIFNVEPSKASASSDCHPLDKLKPAKLPGWQ